jgi:hypothetical protein
MSRNTEKETKNSSHTDRHKDALKKGMRDDRQTEIHTSTSTSAQADRLKANRLRRQANKQRDENMHKQRETRDSQLDRLTKTKRGLQLATSFSTI